MNGFYFFRLFKSFHVDVSHIFEQQMTDFMISFLHSNTVIFCVCMLIESGSKTFPFLQIARKKIPEMI